MWQLFSCYGANNLLCLLGQTVFFVWTSLFYIEWWKFCSCLIHWSRHRWTGRYEAHLWDNSCRKDGQTRKGRQGWYKIQNKRCSESYPSPYNSFLTFWFLFSIFEMVILGFAMTECDWPRLAVYLGKKNRFLSNHAFYCSVSCFELRLVDP